MMVETRSDAACEARRRAAATAGAWLRTAGRFALALLTVGLCGGCSGADRTVAAAVEQLARGEAEAAEATLAALLAERPDDPVLAYDLACAHQQRGRVREAKARYADVLARGDRRLRARAHHNLAMLEVDQLAARVGDEVAALPAERRDEVRDLAERALAELQRARTLDPGLDEVVRRQDLLARWLRVAEDAWRQRDRQAERDTRARLEGPAFLAAVIEAERELAQRLAAGELLEDVELRQRDLHEELPTAKQRFDDEAAPLAAAFRDEVAAAVEAAGPQLEAVAGLLRDARVDAAVAAIERAADELTAPWVLWADPGAVLDVAARGAGGFASALQQVTVARRADPDGADLEVLARAQQALAARAGWIRTWVENLARRLGPEHADPAWSARFVARARDALPAVSTSLQRVADRIDATGPQALIAATRAARELQSLGLEWQLAAMEAGPLAARLEAEEQRLCRAADALREPGAEVDGVADALRRVASGVARSLAWTPVRGDQADQLARVDYLEEAVERQTAPPDAAQSETGQPAEPDPQAAADAEQRAALRARLEPLVAAVRSAFARAAAAAADGPSADTVGAMHDARIAVRAVAVALGDLDGLLGRAADEQASLARRSEAIVAAGSDASAGLAVPLRDAAREQGVTAQLVQQLDLAVDAERAALERDGAPGAEPPAEATAADREERAARRAVLDEIGALLAEAADAATGARDTLDGEAGDDAARHAAFAAAAPAQRRAADLLADAVERLRDAQLPLVELAQRIVDGETGIVAVARELAAGRTPVAPAVDPAASTPGWERVRDGQREAGGYVARLPAALERERAQAGAVAGPGAPDADALRPLVDAVVDAHAAAVDALEPDEPTGAVPATEAVLDAARALWRELAEFQPLLERAVAEQAELVARSEALAAAPDAEADRVDSAVGDQRRVGELVPPLQQKFEAQAAQQAQQAQLAQPTDPSQPAPAGGLSEEVVALARRNLPAAGAAIADAERHVGARAWNDALDRQEEAHRLLREILDALEDEQQEDQQDQQDQQEQQDQQQPSEQPDPSDAQLSDAELQRLLQAVRERNDRRPEPAARTPVQEDW